MNILSRVAWKQLWKNKTRTMVTVVGIVLSAAMFSAVTTCVSSLRQYMVDMVISSDGAWHGAEYDVDQAELGRLQDNSAVKQIGVAENLGYALIGSQNEYKPYLWVQGIDAEAEALLPIHLISGRMPENDGELLLPKHLATNGGVKYQLGDSVNLTLGTRTVSGETLGQKNAFNENELLTPDTTRRYTVVGFYERPQFEQYSAPGYTALTVAGAATSFGGKSDVYIVMNKMNDIYALLKDSVYGNEVNSDLLRYSGLSDENSFNKVLYGMAAILTAIIVFGSISLIYNAFSISISERTRQFGVLKSMGATNRQIKHSVLFEALVLCGIGIPTGLFCGVAGIGITLHFTGSLFDSIVSTDYGAALRLHVSLFSLLAAAVIGLCTVLLSAYLPARKAIRLSAIDSIRQTTDIAIKAKRVRTPRWILKLFGFEGMLADKNFKRNRKKYRATVVSLFLSVVLFISASSFCSYMTHSVNAVVDQTNYDLSYTLVKSESKMSPAQLKEEMLKLNNVSEAAYSCSNYYGVAYQEQDYSTAYRSFMEKQMALEGGEESGLSSVSTMLVFLEDDTYDQYLKSNNMDPALFGDPAAPKAVALDFFKFWNADSGKYETYHIFGQQELDFSFTKIPNQIGAFTITDSTQYNDGKPVYVYENEAGERLEYESTDPLFCRNGTIGAVLESAPFGVDSNSYSVTLIYPLRSMSAVMGDGETGNNVNFYMRSSSPETAETDLSNLLSENDLSTSRLNNSASWQESSRALVAIITVFSYGFIILISLIALANVFNTISTNINLRRREFAMLKSVGMTQGGFNRMMNYECVLYGVKGLIYGLPVAVLVTFLIYLSISGGLETRFYIPWYSVSIAVFSVFFVVFATMLYSMSRVKRENPIDALKNENL